MKQITTQCLADEDFAMDKAQDRIDLKEAVIDDIEMEIEDVTEIYGVPA